MNEAAETDSALAVTTGASAGTTSTCVLNASGVQCMGNNDAGELGQGAGDFTALADASTVTGLSSPSSLSVGDRFACATVEASAITSNAGAATTASTRCEYASLFTIGSVGNRAGNFDSVFTGYSHTCALSDDDGGQAFCWAATHPANSARIGHRV